MVENLKRKCCPKNRLEHQMHFIGALRQHYPFPSSFFIVLLDETYKRFVGVRKCSCNGRNNNKKS